MLNVQGDLPTIEPDSIRAALAPLSDSAVDIATIGTEIAIDAERADPNVVKAVVAIEPPARSRPCRRFDGDDRLHHIRIRAFGVDRDLSPNSRYIHGAVRQWRQSGTDRIRLDGRQIALHVQHRIVPSLRRDGTMRC